MTMEKKKPVIIKWTNPKTKKSIILEWKGPQAPKRFNPLQLAKVLNKNYS